MKARHLAATTVHCLGHRYIGIIEGAALCCDDGALLEITLGDVEGTELGCDDGTLLGMTEGVALGTALGCNDGAMLGLALGTADGTELGCDGGALLGTLLGNDEGTKLGIVEGMALAQMMGNCLEWNSELQMVRTRLRRRTTNWNDTGHCRRYCSGHRRHGATWNGTRQR